MSSETEAAEEATAQFEAEKRDPNCIALQHIEQRLLMDYIVTKIRDMRRTLEAEGIELRIRIITEAESKEGLMYALPRDITIND